MEAFAPIITAIRTAGPPMYAAALIGTGLILFLPSNLLQHIGLDNFRATHLSEIGGVFIGAASLVAVHICFGAAKFARKRWGARAFKRNVGRTLSELTADEKEFLRPFIWGGKNTNYAQISDGVANGLYAKGIVYRASSMSIPGTNVLFPWNLQPVAREVLNRKPELLE